MKSDSKSAVIAKSVSDENKQSDPSNLLSVLTRIIDEPGKSAFSLPPDIAADVLLTALEADPPSSDHPLDDEVRALNTEAPISVQDGVKSTLSPEMTKADTLKRIGQYLPKVQKIFPPDVAPYRIDVLEKPTGQLVRMMLQIRSSEIKQRTSYREAFDELLKAMNVPFPRLQCGTKIGQNDTQMYEWLTSFALSAKDKREEADLLNRAMVIARSPYAIGVFSRVLQEWDLSKQEGRRLVSSFTGMLSRISIDPYINGQLLLTDLINLRALVEYVGPKTEIGQSILLAANDYVARRVSAGYCIDYLATEFYLSESFFISDALPTSGFKAISKASFPASLFQELTRERVQENYSKNFSSPLGKALIGPEVGEVKNTFDLISFIDRMLPGAEGAAKKHFIKVLIYDWVEQGRPAPPAVPGLMRALAILNDDPYWNGDTENWRNSAIEFFKQINMSDDNAREQIMKLAFASKHQGIRLYANLAANHFVADGEEIARAREAEKNEKENKDTQIIQP